MVDTEKNLEVKCDISTDVQAWHAESWSWRINWIAHRPFFIIKYFTHD